MQHLNFVLGGVQPLARRSGAATLSGGTARLAEHGAQHAAARLATAEEVAQDRAGSRENLVVAAALLLGLQHIGAALGGLQLRLQCGDLGLVLVAQRGRRRVALGVGVLITALVERVGSLAGPAEQLQLLVRLEFDTAAAHQVVDQVALDDGPEGLGLQRRLRELIRDTWRYLDAEIAIVVVDSNCSRRIDLLAKWEENCLVLLVVNEAGFLVVVAQRDASNDGGFVARAARVAADYREPGCRNVCPADGHSTGDLRHQRGFVVGESAGRRWSGGRRSGRWRRQRR